MERRSFLKFSSAIAAASAVGSPMKALARSTADAAHSSQDSSASASSQAPLRTLSNDLSIYSGAWGDAQIRHLLRRTMFGVPNAQITAARTIGSMDALVTKLLDTSAPLPAPPGSWVDEYLAPDSSISDPHAVDLDLHNVANQQATRIRQLNNWWLDAMLSTNLSLLDKMAFMWSNHFVVGSNVVKQPGYLYQYIQTLRTNALGNLKTFVRAIATEPAMLIYLNGNQNYWGQDPTGKAVGDHVNENFAREVMELFTMGLKDPKTGSATYVQSDVANSGQALSGWQPSTTAPFQGVFLPQCHNPGPKTFLGQTGNWNLDDILNIIFQQEAGYTVAYFVCQKIYANFVYWVPNPSVIDAMANLLLQSNWELKPVMTALLSSAHFYDANVIGAHLKSPMEFIGGMMREFELSYLPYSGTDPAVSGTDANGYNTFYDTNPGLTFLIETIGLALGQEMLNPPNVKGWPIGPDWITTKYYQSRQDYAAKLLSYPVYYNRSPNVNGVYLDFQADNWMQSWPDSAKVLLTPLTLEIEADMLAIALGPIETKSLYDIANALQLPESEWHFSKDYGAAYAVAIAHYPEFQLI